MRKAIALLISVFLPTIALSDTLNLSWVQPTQRVDGSPLPVSEIAGYRLSWTVRGVAQPVRSVPAGTTYVLDTGTLSGRTCVSLQTIDTDGLVSDPSATVCRNAKPNPPTALEMK